MWLVENILVKVWWLNISPFPFEYISSFMNFVVNNQEKFQTISAVYGITTSNK
jgi:hypothetical protein